MYAETYTVPDLYFPNIRIMMTDLYESDQIVHEVADYYRSKIIRWLKNGEFDEILSYFVVRDGKVSIIDKGGSSTNPKEDIDMKIKHIKQRILTKDGMIKLVEKVKHKTGISAYDFSKNNKFIKHTIKSIFKRQLKKAT